MARQLRPRKTRKNYAALLRYEDEDADENEYGPSQPQPTFDEEDSGSDFAPPPADDDAGEVTEDENVEADHNVEEDEEDQLDEDEEGSVGPGRDVLVAGQGRGRGRGGKGKGSPKDSSTVNIGVGRGLRSAPKNHTLPALSVHHRHKAIPIFHRYGRVERLVRPPVLFGENETVPTNSYTSSRVTTGKLNRAWGYNVGNGPLWALSEDRGWYKEEEEGDGEEWWDGNRRPRVHDDLNLVEGWSVLNDTLVLFLASVATISDSSILP